MSTTTTATTVAGVAEQARSIGDMDAVAVDHGFTGDAVDVPGLGGAPDWYERVEAVLDTARGAHIDLPLPQLLLAMTARTEQVATTAEAGRHVAVGFEGQWADMLDALVRRRREQDEQISALRTDNEALRVRVERLERAASTEGDRADWADALVATAHAQEVSA